MEKTEKIMQLLEPITIRTVPSRFQEWTEEELEQYYYYFLREEDKKDVMKGEDQ